MGKIIITGTGRSGTSFLVHLLSAIGLDTGYTEEFCERELSNECQGGCEHNIDSKHRIMKNPYFATRVGELLKLDIDHVIIPIRELDASAQSRENGSKTKGGYGGFWLNSTTKEEQKDANAKLMYNLIEKLTCFNILFTTISFPKMVEDADYLYLILKSIFKDYSSAIAIEENFDEAFKRVADTEKVRVR